VGVTRFFNDVIGVEIKVQDNLLFFSFKINLAKILIFKNLDWLSSISGWQVSVKKR